MNAKLLGGSLVVAALAVGYVTGGMGSSTSARRPDPRIDELAKRVAAMESRAASTRRAPAARSAPDAVAPPRAAADAPASHDLLRRVVHLEERLADAAARTAEIVAWAGGLAPPPRDPEAEEARYRDLTDPALLEELRNLSRARFRSENDKQTGIARTLLACKVALDRTLESEDRAAVLIVQGTFLRMDGDFGASESSLKEALAHVAEDTDRGRDATAQLAFTAVFQQDFDLAAERFLSVYRQSTATPEVRARFRRLAGLYLENVDADRARSELQGVVDEFGALEGSHVQAEVEQARGRLAELDGVSK